MEVAVDTAVIARARELEHPERAVIATDPAGLVIYWSPGAERLYGWTSAEALGRSIMDLTPTDLSRADAEGIMRTLISGRSWSGAFEVQAKDGSSFIVDVKDLPVRDRAGKLIGIIGSSHRTNGR